MSLGPFFVVYDFSFVYEFSLSFIHFHILFSSIASLFSSPQMPRLHFMRHVAGLLGEFVFLFTFSRSRLRDGRNKEAFCVADDIPLI
jgi:hypothetical protein